MGRGEQGGRAVKLSFLLAKRLVFCFGLRVHSTATGVSLLAREGNVCAAYHLCRTPWTRFALSMLRCGTAATQQLKPRTRVSRSLPFCVLSPDWFVAEG